ncbi:MAG: NHLP leader peptide family RiPP precursor [Myxococcales bacterium]|nr:NHLP leader peptide family RiPP precursor [Myxococcales bacterium]USN51570.1 MAG: NHLP leader peptide family natural product precursor [Myxococcales bacterium]
MDKELIRDYELDIIVKAWRDENFRQQLLKDPKNAIEREFDIKVPHDMNISVHEENEQSLHLIVPSVPPHFITGDLSDDELKDVIGGVMATGHLAALPKAEDRKKIRELKKEIEQLKNELVALKK